MGPAYWQFIEAPVVGVLARDAAWYWPLASCGTSGRMLELPQRQVRAVWAWLGMLINLDLPGWSNVGYI